MKRCPYCGRDNEEYAEVCEHCRAGLPAEKQKEQPKKADKKSTRSEK